MSFLFLTTQGSQIIIDNATNIQKALRVLNNLQTSVVNEDENDADVNV